MPYIPSERRPELDKVVDLLNETLETPGDLNYVLFALCRRHVTPSYHNYLVFLGELNECSAEVRRRILAPYENEKIIINGDVT